MGAAIHQGCCGGCGKVYRIPRAEGGLTCPTCGGDVRPQSRKAARGRPGGRRRRGRRGWIGLAMLIALIAAGYGLHAAA